MLEFSAKSVHHMAAIIRRATPTDAPRWLELAKLVLGADYPVKQVYDPAWIASQLNPGAGQETWVAEANQQLTASISLLSPSGQNTNPVIHAGRQLFSPASLADGSAKELIHKIGALADERAQWVVIRVLTSDNPQQVLLESLAYVCVGFQPAKHMLRTREGVVFYLRNARQPAASRLPISEALPHISELSTLILKGLHIATPTTVRDSATGYPLQTELNFQDGTHESFENFRLQVQSINPPVEVSRGYNLGVGWLRVSTGTPLRVLFGRRGERTAAAVSYLVDEMDHCVRIIDACSADELAMGAMFSHLLKIAQDREHAVYVEVDVLAGAPRLLKCTEQLGFVPVAYLPGFYRQNTQYSDVVKLVKLNLLYSSENATLTAQVRAVVATIDHNFQDQKMGLAIINLLRSLPIFGGLGEGELRKIARLFTQKLYRPGEVVFQINDVGNEAYVVMRGQVDVFLPNQPQPIASITNGQIFGEQAFLDGAARGATLKASQASILLVVQRSAFNELVEREPHLGMVIMRNTAIELSHKLRKANASLAEAKKAKA